MNQANNPPRQGLAFERVMPIFVLVFVDVLGLTVILPLLHLYGAAYGASPAQIGLLAAAFPLAQIIGVPVMGALSDRFGRKPLLLISQITTFAGFILLGVANSFALVILSRVIDGLFGANLATAQAALSDITDEDNRAAGLGLTGAAFGLGFILGPVLSIIALEMTGSLAAPAFTAAGYSLISILLTLFVFKETLPPEQRGKRRAAGDYFGPVLILRMITRLNLLVLLVMLFSQQLIFFGFETLMGLFTLSRLGFLGQANALLFILIGIILVTVQVRYIGKWTRRYGEHRVARGALALLAGGLLLVAATPDQPHLFYVKARVQFELAKQAPATTEVIVGDIDVPLPQEGRNGIGGVLWMIAAIVPLSVGAGLIRPSINSLLTKRVAKEEYGAVLGVSSAFISAANAAAPILGGLIFQAYGPTMPFLSGGLLMLVLAFASLALIQPARPVQPT